MRKSNIILPQKGFRARDDIVSVQLYQMPEERIKLCVLRPLLLLEPDKVSNGNLQIWVASLWETFLYDYGLDNYWIGLQ